jgi:hypothetical protein
MTKKNIALITGASSGIGRAFALQLADRCEEMILVARDRQSLQEVASQLVQRGVKVDIMVLDLLDPIARGRLVEAIRQKGPVTYLINNAGFASLGNFDANTLAEQQQMVDLHITTTLALSRAVIPFMKEQGRGTIINVSSMAAFAPFASLAVYGASKAFLNSFSQALADELKEHGILVQCLCPGYTRTQFHKREAFGQFDETMVPDELWMEPAAVVQESLDALSGGQVIFVAGEKNRAMVNKMADRAASKSQTH